MRLQRFSALVSDQSEHDMAPLKPRGKVEAEQASDYEFYSIATDLLSLDQGTIRKKSPSDDEMRATAACGVFYRWL